MDIIKKLFNSNITYYIIVPYSILVFEWIKKWYDENKGIDNFRPYKKTKALFYEVSLFVFRSILNAATSLIIISSMFSSYGIEVVSILCLLFISKYINYIKNTPSFVELKLEFLVYKNLKIIFLFLQVFIMFMPFLLPYNNITIILIWTFSLIIWFFFMYIFSDKVITYNNKYADIHMNDNVIIKQIRIDKLQKNGAWVYVNMHEENKSYRIKISNIDRIEYYGDPLIIIESRIPPYIKK